MGAPDINVPAPSAAEKNLQAQQAALLQEQTNLLKQQQQQQSVLLPFIGQQYGLDIQIDDQGNITGITQSDTAGAERRAEIQKLEEERSLAALKGELPVDPTLERNLQTQEQTLRERLQQQFGPGYETSTPGIQTLDEFFRSAESLRYGARTGELTLAEQLSLARQNSNLATGSTIAGNISGATLGQQLGLAGAFGQAAQGYGQAQQPYQFNRNLQYSGNVAQQNLMQNYLAGIGSAAGQGVSAALLFSDRSLKDDIIRIEDTLWGGGIYTYRLKGDSIVRIGLMADEVLEEHPEAVVEKDGYLAVDYGVL